VIVHIVAPKVDAEAAAAGEPEVIKKGKKDDKAPAADAKAKKK
jgi:hypothetical protein